MSIRKWDPLVDLIDLRRSFDKIFEDFTRRGIGFEEETAKDALWAPNVDILDEDSTLVIKAELPGVSPKDVDITLKDDILTVKGERKFKHEEKKKNYLRIERSYGSFSRSFNLGQPVKADEIAASYKDGVLEIRLPKAESAKPKKIEVKTE